MLNDILYQPADFARGDEAAFFYHQKLAGSPRGERDVLLDQDYRQPDLLIKPNDDVLNFLHDVWLNALRRLLEQQPGRFGCQNSGANAADAPRGQMKR
jgi:hypothetical protein